ncbi:hypothetical protein [[Phormidium] sp. ETS-05]|uniref:hypothetical protein n=1 Tax=[Phormidium] sp. ETS-05 TaxID=222819 RepID=UPI0018EF163F|nr:hypothetical protein [[Phormidium] sp. ETS-05]
MTSDNPPYPPLKGGETGRRGDGETGGLSPLSLRRVWGRGEGCLRGTGGTGRRGGRGDGETGDFWTGGRGDFWTGGLGDNCQRTKDKGQRTRD